jgi:hypothetical protein
MFLLKIFVELKKVPLSVKIIHTQFLFRFKVFGLTRNILLLLEKLVGENDLSLSHSFWNIQKSSPSDKKIAGSTHFGFVSILSFDIETFVLSFRYGRHYSQFGESLYTGGRLGALLSHSVASLR